MRKPKMMIFDYGHTLCYEPEQDYARGWRAAMEHAVENPRGITAEQLYEYSRGVYAGLFAAMRPLELETDGLKLDESIFDALGLRFDVSMQELEYIRWCATEPIFPMEGIEDFLALCAELGIRTGVISNLSFSGATLIRRINECLPFHRFEFIVASSECVFRNLPPRPGPCGPGRRRLLVRRRRCGVRCRGSRALRAVSCVVQMPAQVYV